MAMFDFYEVYCVYGSRIKFCATQTFVTASGIVYSSASDLLSFSRR